MYRRRDIPPWLIFLTAIALIMGLYYLWIGIQNYLATGGLGVEAATEQAVVVSTTQAVVRATEAIPTRTSFPTFTPLPPCQDWIVTVPSGIVRGAPTVNSPIIDTVNGGDEICVIEQVDESEWYLIDANTNTTRIEEAYMRNDIIRPLNPTTTPTNSPTPLPTITPITPTETPTRTSTPLPPTETPIPSPTATPTQTPRTF